MPILVGYSLPGISLWATLQGHQAHHRYAQKVLCHCTLQGALALLSERSQGQSLVSPVEGVRLQRMQKTLESHPGHMRQY